MARTSAPPRVGGFNPNRLEYELARRGLNRSDLLKPPAKLSSSTLADLFLSDRYRPTATVLSRLRAHLTAFPVDPILDALMDPVPGSLMDRPTAEDGEPEGTAA